MDRAHQHLSETELVNLTLCVAAINTWNRIAIRFRAVHVPSSLAARHRAVDRCSPKAGEASRASPGLPSRLSSHVAILCTEDWDHRRSAAFLVDPKRALSPVSRS